MRRFSLAAAALMMSVGAAPVRAGDVIITITDVRSTKGVVRACMTAKAETFPRCNQDAGAQRVVVKADNTLEIRFTAVKPGAYAVAILHDENDNGKADRAMGMMPKEGYGFSRDAPVKMAPPKFRDAVFDQGEGTQRLTIRMRYFL